MDNYQLNEEVGKGSFSTAYKGRRRRTTNFYAILSTDKCRRLRVLNSVHILRAVQHPCVIKFYNWFETNNHLWVITEYCSGGDLCSILKDTLMSETSLRVLGRDIATGLMHFHSLGYLYNDLKPDNLLMDSIPSLRFYDFGNSCPISLATQRHLVGTPAYLAPELFLPQSGVVSMAADLWSLGCVLYEMACGSPPFMGTDLPSLLKNILTQPVPRVEKFSNEFNNLLAGLLEKDPRKRFTWTEVAASEFWEELLALPINGFPPEPAFAEYAKQPFRHCTDEQLNMSVAAAVAAATANLTPNSRKSEESFKTKAIAFEELDFTPTSSVEETPVERVGGAGQATASPQNSAVAVQPTSSTASTATGKTGVHKVLPDAKGAVAAALAGNTANANNITALNPAGTPANSKQAQLSKTERAAKARDGQQQQQHGAGGVAPSNPERSGSADMDRDKTAANNATTGKVEVEVVCLDASVSIDIRECIWHHSDTHIRPLCMNGRIERYIEPTVPRDSLSFPYHTFDEVKQMNHEAITTFLANAFRALSNEKQQETRVKILAYFEIICKDPSIANILINSTTMDFCFRQVDDPNSTSELRAQAAMVIGQLVRHTTFIHQDVVRAGIIQRTMNLFTKETDMIVRRRLLVCLGELLFYVAVQTAAEREGWQIQTEPIQQLYMNALESDDDVLRHYAIKGIENVASVSDRYMANKLFATPAIVQRLTAIYRAGQGTQSKGEHMRSSAICAVCKLGSASDLLLPVILQSKVFPVSEYPAAIKRSHIPLTSQLLLTLLVYGLHRSMELVKTKDTSTSGIPSVSSTVARQDENSSEALIGVVTGISGRVLESVRELNDKSTTAMRGKCLLLISLLASLGGSTLAQICTNHFPAFLDRLMADKDAYVQQCVAPFSQSLSLYILDKLRSLRKEVTSPLYVHTLRQLLSSSLVRKSVDLDPETFQFLGECVQKCLVRDSSHNKYEDEFHSVMECFLAPELAQTKLHAICTHLLPALQSMVQAPNGASRFFAVRLLYTFVSSLLIEYPNSAAPHTEALQVVTNATANVTKVLPELIKEPQPLPSHTFRLLAACGEWNITALEPLATTQSLNVILQHLCSPKNTEQMRPLQVLHMMLTHRPELIRPTLESDFHRVLLRILSQPISAENVAGEAACSVVAAMFPVGMDEGVLSALRKRFPGTDLEPLENAVLRYCMDDRLASRYASSAVEGMVRVSTQAQQILLHPGGGLAVLVPLCKGGPSSENRQEALQALLRAMRYAAKELVAYPALGKEATVLLALHNIQVQGWNHHVTEEATKFLHEIEESTTFSYPTPVHS